MQSQPKKEINQNIHHEYCGTLIKMCNDALAENSSDKYMTHALRNEFREALVKMRNQALNESEDNQADTTESQRMPDEIDSASINEAAAMTLRRRERTTGLLRNIANALTRINTPDFGYCAECDSEIGIPRLRARPTACLCIACKESAEKAETQFFKQRAA
jgi:DnaK suppressor protein